MNSFDSLSNDEFVEFCYRHFLRRAPDAGAAYWLQLLSDGARRVEVIQQIISSAEYLELLDRHIGARAGNEITFPGRWQTYEFDEVVDADIPAAAVRNYMEQSQLRSFLRYVSEQRTIEKACEIGCGYGRMTQLLPEFAHTAIGFEREPQFVQRASHLIPAVTFKQMNDPVDLDVPSADFDFVLTFTFLQHLTDVTAGLTVREIQRILKPAAYVLCCEETDSRLRNGDTDDPSGLCTIGRSIERYCEMFAPLVLVKSCPRQLEPGYPREEVGAYMLFGSP